VTGSETTTVASDLGQPSGCQQHVHAKAFKGKGEAGQRLSKARRTVDDIHQRMRELSDSTRAIAIKTFYLAVHMRQPSGQVSLRWRRAGTARHSHLRQEDMAQEFARYPTTLATWYSAVDQIATELNHAEQMARAALRHAQLSAQPSGNTTPDLLDGTST